MGSSSNSLSDKSEFVNTDSPGSVPATDSFILVISVVVEDLGVLSGIRELAFLSDSVVRFHSVVQV